MFVYFVRHGKTPLGEKGTYQLGDTPLSERGREEAVLIAKRVSEIEFDALVSSTFLRAKETAAELQKYQKKAVYSETDLFVEIKRPSEVEGRSADDPEVKKIYKAVKENHLDPSWRYSDEESFTMVLRSEEHHV